MADNLQLIHLSQINGGLALKEAIDLLRASYPADQVTTRISKGEGSSEQYNVEELLLLLKTIVDTQLGNSEGSVAERLEALKEELQANIDAINNREVKDRVKVTGTIDAAGTMTLADYSGVTALDQSIDYIVYYENNKPVRDAEGKNVTYNFGTDALSDTPHVRQVNVTTKDVAKKQSTVGTDKRTYNLANINVKTGSVSVFRKDEAGNPVIPVDPADYYVNTVSGKILFKADQTEDIYTDYQHDVSELTFVPLIGAASIKLFPIGTFKFRQLPVEYLLDNTELNLIAYSEVIDELVLGLASDKELIEHVISLIGTEAVQNAIIGMTEALQKRVSDLETAVANIDQAYKAADDALKSNLESQIGEEETRAKDTEKALDDKITALNKKTTKADIDRQNDIMDVNHRIDNMAAVTDKHEDIAVVNEQVDIELEAIPTADPVVITVNCIPYREGKHFTVDRIATPKVKLTWTFTSEFGGFDLLASFDVAAHYKVKADVAPVTHIPDPA